MEVTSRPATAHDRRVAIALAVALAGLAALAYSLSALLEFTLSADQSLDPHRTGFVTAGGLAAVLCVVALWRLRTVSRGRTEWLDAGLSFALAVVALLTLVLVAFGSRLGG